MQPDRNAQRGVRRHWQRVIAAQERSGLTQQHYCEDLGVSLAQFRYWKYQGLGRSRFQSAEETSFLPVTVVQAVDSNEGTRSAGVSFVVADGALHLDVGFDEDTLLRAAQVLRALAC